jgi:nicotinate-nucleotide pyrophosphorylase (carboxylating)
MNHLLLDDFLIRALHEDIANGDITTDSCVPADRQAVAKLLAKADGVACGLEAAARVFTLLDASIVFSAHVREGGLVRSGDAIATVKGPARALLTGERTALNLLQRMSGIATATAAAVQSVRGTGTRITDTRKTAPGLRMLDKYAVRAGGGSNHRVNLADGVLIKDNHIAAAGGITAAVTAARQNVSHTLKIEVETETLEQVREALEAGADVIMLDNMDTETMAEAVRIVAGRALTEASGNMHQKDLAAVAAAGVDLISIGALTHTAAALDISMKLELI